MATGSMWGTSFQPTQTHSHPKRHVLSNQCRCARGSLVGGLRKEVGRLAREQAAEDERRRLRIGLYSQYFAVGVIYGGLPQTMYGFFLGYLNVEAYVYATASTVVALPWSFKFLFGAINDVVPIGGERRRPYIFIGWGGVAVFNFRRAGGRAQS